MRRSVSAPAVAHMCPASWQMRMAWHPPLPLATILVSAGPMDPMLAAPWAALLTGGGTQAPYSPTMAMMCGVDSSLGATSCPRAHLCASHMMLLVAIWCVCKMFLSLATEGGLPAAWGQAPSLLVCPCQRHGRLATGARSPTGARQVAFP